jgi:hypothetical protein
MIILNKSGCFINVILYLIKTVRNAHEITQTSCSLSRRERAGVRGYKWSSYFMDVPKWMRYECHPSTGSRQSMPG